MALDRTRFTVIGVLGLLLAAVIALAAVYFLTRQSKAPNITSSVAVAISATACEPNAMTVPAGVTSFAIRNASDSVIEWEILKGVIVLAERENIAPGFTVAVTPNLEPGIYQMTCGLLSNPKGSLIVTAADGSTVAVAKPPALADLVGPTAEYRVYVILATDDLVTATRALAAAAKAGDLATSQTQYGAAVAAFDRIAPVAGLFGAETTAVAGGPNGLPALEKIVIEGKTTDGAGVIADALASSAIALQASAHTTTASPQSIVAGATAVLIARGKAAGADATAPLPGIRKIVELFDPLTQRADKSLAAKIATDLSAVEASLAVPAKADASPGAAEKSLLHDQLSDLSADFIDLSAALGLNISAGGQ